MSWFGFSACALSSVLFLLSSAIPYSAVLWVAHIENTMFRQAVTMFCMKSGLISTTLSMSLQCSTLASFWSFVSVYDTKHRPSISPNPRSESTVLFSMPVSFSMSLADTRRSELKLLLTFLTFSEIRLIFDDGARGASAMFMSSFLPRN